jgi:hypothetical protein
MNTSISNGDSATPGNITASRLVPEADRMDTVDKLFGLQYVLKLEPLVFQFAEHLAENYEYGYWAFYCLDSGGFYMAPLGNASGTDVIYNVSCPNGFDGQMTADALGLPHAYTPIAICHLGKVTSLKPAPITIIGYVSTLWITRR